MFTRQDITTTVETSPPQLGMNGKGRTWARKARYSPQPFEPDTRDELSVIRRIIHASINSMLLTSLRLIRLLARLEDVLTDGKFVLDEWSVSKFRSRRNVDSFLTTFPHAMFPEMLISCWRPVSSFEGCPPTMSCFLYHVYFLSSYIEWDSQEESMHLTEDILLTYRHV